MARAAGLRVVRAAGRCLAALVVACAGRGGERDAVGPSEDVVVHAGGAARRAEDYEYVARRTFAVVAVAEGRGLDRDAARAAVDHLADSLDVCTTEAGRTGSLPSGAARVVAQVGGDGTVQNTQVRIDPASSGASSALLCLVGPLRQLTFGPSDAGTRGLAIEALWGPMAKSSQ
jgi:hypothetical protein